MQGGCSSPRIRFGSLWCSSFSVLLYSVCLSPPISTRPKMEIATKEPGNPIKQDVKKGNLRRFTYGDLPFNYGAIPQTWENPHETHPLTKLAGDNDPIDVVELSKEPIQMGAVRAVKVVGVIALLDEGETDWKILAIDSTNPLADSVKTIEDIETHFPGQINTVREWLRNYKTTVRMDRQLGWMGELASVDRPSLESGVSLISSLSSCSSCCFVSLRMASLRINLPSMRR